jgi:hypothetical protein
MTAPGIIPDLGAIDLPRAEYDALPDRVNFSTLKELAKSPQAYLYKLLNIEEGDTDSMLRGRAVHMRVFEPELFRSTYVVWSERRAGKFWEAFEKKARLEGHEVLTAKMHEHVIQLADAIRANAMAAPYLANGKREQTVLWELVRPAMGALPGYRVRCKGRMDFIQAERIVDLKTCRSAEPRKFGFQADALHYHAQAAWYVDGLAAATGTKPRRYSIVAAEEKAPFVTQVFHLTEQQLDAGRQRYWAWLDRRHMCLRENKWTGYADEPLELQLPDFALDPGSDTFGLLFPDEQEAA